MRNSKKLESLQTKLFNKEIFIKKNVMGGFCCTIAGGHNTMQKNGTTVWDCPVESFTFSTKL
jgi:hypothetical protein